MPKVWGAIAILLMLTAHAPPARAERLALRPTHAEADVADEGFAVTVLVRTALSHEPDAAVITEDHVTVRDAAAACARLGVDRIVFIDVAREGTGLRATLAIAGASDKPDVTFVRAGDGAVVTLAQGIVDHVVEVTHVRVDAVPALSLGLLRPYAAAYRVRGDAAQVGPALEQAVPAVARAAPVLAHLLAPIAQAPELPPDLVVIGTRIWGPTTSSEVLAGGADATAIAARALRLLDRHEVTAAEAELRRKTAKPAAATPLLAYAEAVVGERRGDEAEMNDAILSGLATPRLHAFAAFASTIPTQRLPAKVLRALLSVAAQASTDPGVASRIGLAAAEAHVDAARAFALISPRELDDAELARLGKLVTGDSTVAMLRLRTELAMRAGGGADAPAIEAFVAADQGVMAERYLGWLRAGEGNWQAAADAFAHGNAPHDRMRVLASAGDLPNALAAIDGAPASPDELVVAALAAHADGRTADALATLYRAESDAPVDPFLQHAILEVATPSTEDLHATIARLFATRTDKVTAAGVGPNAAVAGSAAAGSAAATSATPGSATNRSATPGGIATTRPNQPATAPAITRDDIDVDTAARLASDLDAILSALPELRGLRSARIALVELRWKPPPWSFHTSAPELLRPYLVKALADPPYRLQIAENARPAVDEGTLHDEAALDVLRGSADGVLAYRVDDNPKLTLVLYQAGSPQLAEASGQISLPDLVVWNRSRLLSLAAVALLVAIAIAMFMLRATGGIRVDIVKAPDTSDEVFCVAITKHAARPEVGDPNKFNAKIAAAGTTRSRRVATAVTTGVSFRVPTGSWFVHLYGTYQISRTLRTIHESFTKQVELRRGDFEVVAFDLVPKLAEVHVETGLPGKRVAVYVDENERMFTNDVGHVVLFAPKGRHTLTLEVDGQTFKRSFVVAAASIVKVSVNLARELKLGAMSDLALDSQPGGVSQPIPRHDELVLDDENAETINVSDTAPEPPPVSGKLVFAGRYKVVGKLGRGAMGVVHRAFDQKLEREVAIKELADEFRENPDALRLFVQEAKALAQLNHPNIVALYDQVTDGDKLLMVMELVDGRTLDVVLRERRSLPWQEVVRLVDQLCAGLAYAHAHKVIHRDIKPGNIFITRDERVKLGDFGLARVLRDVMIHRTEIRGTPAYMAPEQVTGTNIDYRADLYAVGSTMFYLVCGRAPWDHGEIMFKKLHDPPPRPSSLGAQLPPKLDDLVVALMAREPEDRPRSADDVRAWLRQLR